MQVTYNNPVAPNGARNMMPGGITDSPMDFATTATASKLTWDFTVDRLPTNGNFYYWAFQFYFTSGRVGYIGFQNNGNLLTQNEVGGVVNYAIWNTTGGTAGPNGQVGSFDHEGDGMRAPSRLPGFSANHTYTTTLTVAGNVVTANVLDQNTGVNTLVGSINVPAGEMLKSDGVAFSEVYVQAENAAAVTPLTATWSNFKADAVAGTMVVYPAYHTPSGINAGVDYVTDVTASSLSHLTGGTGGNTIFTSDSADTSYLGSGNNTLDLGAGNDTVYLGTGSATINGNTGMDTAVAAKTAASYTVAQTTAKVTVTDKANPASIVTLTNFEVLKFSDSKISLAATTAAPAVVPVPGKASDVLKVISEPHANSTNYFLLTVALHTSDIKVHFNTVDSGTSAMAGVDFTSRTMDATMAAGVTTLAFGVEILSNNYAEAQEDFSAHVLIDFGTNQVELVATHTILAHSAWIA